MGLISWLKGVIGKMFESTAQEEFKTDIIHSGNMETSIQNWKNIYYGNPEWVDEEDGIKTINFAKAVASETARLVTLDLDINVSGSARADFLQTQIDAMYKRIREFTERMCVYGTIALKPNGKGVDYVTPDNFLITEIDGAHNITGIIFFDYYDVGKKHYTRMEWHRFEGDTYMISNRAYLSENEGEIGKYIDLAYTPTWSELLPDVAIKQANGKKLDKPLFSICKMPEANNVDSTSPLGIAIFSGAIEELKDLDIAYSRNAGEIYDSQSIELLDDRLLIEPGTKMGSSPKFKLPHHVKNVSGSEPKDFYQAIDRPLKTDIRKTGINQQLSLIGYKCGYSNGYFTFDEKTGMITATQVESDDRRTIQLIKDIRDALKGAITDLIFAMDKYDDLYQLAPVGAYDVSYAFGDITYNWDEDRLRHWQYVQSGKYPLWRYYVKFEGFSEEEAKALVEEARGENPQPSLFGSEE